MLRFVTFFCLAIILSGCGEAVTRATFKKSPGDDKMIVGYGKGELTTATLAAWKDARIKLDISGLGEHYGLTESSTQYRYDTAWIVFKLIPLNELESTKHDNDSGELPKKTPADTSDPA
jgi:hypothetical protein